MASLSPLRYPTVYALLSGVLLVLSFPRPQLSLLAWVALAPLLVVLMQNRARWRLFLYGYVAGVVFFGGTCYWLYATMRTYGHLSSVASAGVLLLFVLVEAIFFGLFAWITGELARRWQMRALLLAPVAWVAVEYLRTHIPVGGFPWNLLGYAVAPVIGWVQPASYVGVYGLSFLVVAVNMVAALYWLAPTRRNAVPLAVIAVVLFAAWLAGSQLPTLPTPATAVLVQTNLPQQEEFDPQWIQKHPDELEGLEELTRAAARKLESPPALVVWPEMPVSLYFNHDPVIRARMISLAQSLRSHFLTGIVDYKPEADGRYYPRNSAVLLTADGDLIGQYDKIHLVPFGEYLPFGRVKWIEPLVKEVSAFRPGTNYAVMPSGAGRLSVFICYEAIFPALVRRFVEGETGAELLVNISNDGWFDNTAATQHLNMARVRAVETRRYLLRATNTGITAVIDPYGRIIARAPAHRRTVLIASFAPQSTRTWYARLGDWLPLLCALAIVAALGRKFWMDKLEAALSQ
ncbi:MAG TPA: apolipoprotein N-acyltransferase [Candidatus Xenobia bacterium]|nr:apolipoprotein N-acyltransferase [Candidatus Xenobia bacterium]